MNAIGVNKKSCLIECTNEQCWKGKIDNHTLERPQMNNVSRDKLIVMP